MKNSHHTNRQNQEDAEMRNRKIKMKVKTIQNGEANEQQQKAEKQGSFDPEERQGCLPRWRPTRTLAQEKAAEERKKRQRRKREREKVMTRKHI